jgi:hypothetical protein
MGPTRTELHITSTSLIGRARLTPATAKPVDKRAGMDPGAYLTSFDSLWSAYGESPDSSRFTALSGFIENHQPTGMDTTAFKASITSMLRGESPFYEHQGLGLIDQELAKMSRTFLVQSDQGLVIVRVPLVS